MFDRFTERAIKVIILAQEESRRIGHNYVGAEQILLGLIGEGRGVAAQTLKASGIALKDARIEVERIIGRGAGPVSVEIPFTSGAKRIFELSWDASKEFGENYVSSKHLLVGLIRLGDSVALEVVQALGVDPSELENRLLQCVEHRD